MLRSVLAIATGSICAAGVIVYATSLTAFSMDRPRGIEVPFGLGLLIAAVAAAVGLFAWTVVRRRS